MYHGTTVFEAIRQFYWLLDAECVRMPACLCAAWNVPRVVPTAQHDVLRINLRC